MALLPVHSLCPVGVYNQPEGLLAEAYSYHQIGFITDNKDTNGLGC